MESLLRFLFSVGVVLILGAKALFAQPINTNGGFEDATPGIKTTGEVTGWALLAEGGTTATYEIIEGDAVEGNFSLRLEIESLGSNPWDIQAVNEPFTVAPGTEYTYSIWVRSDFDGPIASFTVGSPTFTEWGRANQVVMTPEWQEVTFQFTAPAGATEARAPIHFGESANAPFLPVSFYLDDLRIISQTTGVEEENTIPFSFELSQNYPNPFNPTTSIKYSVGSDQFVSLKVYDALGKEVATLVNERKPAGAYEVTFDAAHLSSGLYSYTLKAGELVETKRMTLVR